MSDRPEDTLSWLRSQILARKATAEAALGKVRTDYYDLSKTAPTSGVWEIEDDYGSPRLREADTCNYVATYRSTDPGEYEDLDPAHAAHIALNDPRDTIARCEAELDLLARYEKQATLWPAGSPVHEESDYLDCVEPERTRALAEAVALVASGYRHCPGWLPEWAPGPAED